MDTSNFTKFVAFLAVLGAFCLGAGTLLFFLSALVAKGIEHGATMAMVVTLLLTRSWLGESIASLTSETRPGIFRRLAGAVVIVLAVEFLYWVVLAYEPQCHPESWQNSLYGRVLGRLEVDAVRWIYPSGAFAIPASVSSFGYVHSGKCWSSWVQPLRVTGVPSIMLAILSVAVSHNYGLVKGFVIGGVQELRDFLCGVRVGTVYRNTFRHRLTKTQVAKLCADEYKVINELVKPSESNPHKMSDKARNVYEQVALKVANTMAEGRRLNNICGVPRRAHRNRSLDGVDITYVWTEDQRFVDEDHCGRRIVHVENGGELTEKGAVAFLGDSDWFYHSHELIKMAENHPGGVLISTLDFKNPIKGESQLKINDGGIKMKVLGGDNYSHGYHDWTGTHGYLVGQESGIAVYDVVLETDGRKLIWLRVCSGLVDKEDALKSYGIRERVDRRWVRSSGEYMIDDQILPKTVILSCLDALMSGGSSAMTNRAIMNMAIKSGRVEAGIPGVWDLCQITNVVWDYYFRQVQVQSWWSRFVEDTLGYWRVRCWVKNAQRYLRGESNHVVTLTPPKPMASGKVELVPIRRVSEKAGNPTDRAADHASRSLSSSGRVTRPAQRGDVGKKSSNDANKGGTKVLNQALGVFKAIVPSPNGERQRTEVAFHDIAGPSFKFDVQSAKKNPGQANADAGKSRTETSKTPIQDIRKGGTGTEKGGSDDLANGGGSASLPPRSEMDDGKTSGEVTTLPEGKNHQ
jgi:hypothetical protein